MGIEDDIKSMKDDIYHLAIVLDKMNNKLDKLLEQTQKQPGSVQSESSTQKNANAMMDILEHPENYCSICGKKKGVCKHSLKG